MAEFVLGRTHTHRSLMGHIINFKKGQPVWVPPVCHREVSAIGAMPVKGDRVDPLDDEPQEKPELTAEERQDQLVAAFKILQSRNARDDFTGQGVPSVSALRKIIDDFVPDRREVEEVWRNYLDELNAEAE